MRINSVNILGSLKQPFKIVHLLTLFMFLQSNNTNKKKTKYSSFIYNSWLSRIECFQIIIIQVCTCISSVWWAKQSSYIRKIGLIQGCSNQENAFCTGATLHSLLYPLHCSLLPTQRVKHEKQNSVWQPGHFICLHIRSCSIRVRQLGQRRFEGTLSIFE